MVRIGVAGRRDYPASARRDNPDANRSDRAARPTAPQTGGGAQNEREERGQADIAAPTDNAAAAGSVAHIAGQRIDSDQAVTESTAAGSKSPATGGNSTGIGGEPTGVGGKPTAANGKEKPRRSAGKAAKGDRTKPAKSEAVPPSVPGARLSAYAEEAAELLAGLSPDRRRRKEDGDADAEKDPTSTEPATD